MHFRQGANGKINYQQAKALALHFCWREKGTRGVWKEEEEEGVVVVVKKWKERRVEKTTEEDREMDGKETAGKRSREKGKRWRK